MSKQLTLLLLLYSLTTFAIDCENSECQDGGGNKLVYNLPSLLFKGQKVTTDFYVIDSITGAIDTSYSGTLNMLISSGPGSVLPPSNIILNPSKEYSFGIDIDGIYEIIFRADGLSDDTLSISVYENINCEPEMCNQSVEANAIGLNTDPDVIVADASTLMLVYAFNQQTGIIAGNYTGTGTINLLSGPGNLLGNNVITGNHHLLFADMVFTEAGSYEVIIAMTDIGLDTFYLDVVEPTAVSEIIGKKHFKMFPNPVEPGYKVVLKDSDFPIKEVRFYSIQGRLLLRQNLMNVAGDFELQVPQVRGVILVEVLYLNNEMAVQKLVVK